MSQNPQVDHGQGYRAALIREAREHADNYRRYDDTESLVNTLVEMAIALESAPQTHVETSEAQVLAALNAYYAPDGHPGRTLGDWSEGSVRAMRSALHAASTVREAPVSDLQRKVGA